MVFEEEKVFQYIEEHQQEYIDLLGRFCRQPSLAGTHTGIEEMVDIVVQELKKEGLNVTMCPTPGNPCMIAVLPGESEKVFGFYDHYDVQPVEPLNEWQSDPWTLSIRDGKMYARGDSDNKGGLAGSLAAIDAWMHVYGKLPCGVKLMIEGEEEIGSPNLPYFCEKYRDRMDCDGIIFEGGERDSTSGQMILTYGVKGILYVELHARNSVMDAHSSLAAIVENPAWRLVQALSTLQDPSTGKIRIAGFYDGILPLRQDDIDILGQDGFDEEGTRNYLGISQYLHGMTGTELLKNYHYEPTANICGIESGYTGIGPKTVLPASASCKMDFRLVPGQNPDDILKKLQEHLISHGFEDIEVEKILGEPPYRSNPSSPFCQAVAKTAERFSHQRPTIDYQHAGSCPLAYFCAEKNIPAVMAGCGTQNNNIHAPNEFLEVKDFVDDIKFRCAMMNELARTESK